MSQKPDIQLSKEDLHLFFNEYFAYYLTLNSYWKNVFVTRVLQFIDSKGIHGADGFTVNNKVRAIIAASAVQLTLGLETWDYDYFQDIIIHPKVYVNTSTNQLHKGETNLAGYVRLSWKSFIDGYKNQHDNLNLGIHEFSHALRFNGIRGNDEDYYLKYFFIIWLGTAYEAHYHLKQGKQTIFRAYGGTNINEFISVCMEHYFESPDQIKAHYPLLYYNTAILLNQVTVNNVTEINIREKYLHLKNQLANPIKNRELKTSFIHSPSISLLFITGTLFLITGISSGFFSGPSLTLLLLAVLFYLRIDFYNVNVSIKNNELEFKKGILVFKYRKPNKAMISQLISLSVNKHNKTAALTFMYFNLADNHFYEEETECSLSDAEELLSEFKANKVPVKRI